MDLTAFFDALWTDFIGIAPKAADIRAHFEGLEGVVPNDHVAFRTFDIAPINIEHLEPLLFELGYERVAPYFFEEKKLRAFGYSHKDGSAPRIFLSELMTEQFSTDFQAIVHGLVKQVDPKLVTSPAIFSHGLPWSPIDWGSYLQLREESEYGAWLAALGMRPNHFTVSITDLPRFQNIEQVLKEVESLGYDVNSSGGRVKGGPSVLLEQGSTVADRMPVTFAGGEVHTIPTCYYEFALRYRDVSGTLYDGFVSASADRIFESTDTTWMAAK